MRRFISFLAVPFLIVGLVWLAAVVHLQQARIEVTGSTLLYAFVIAPTVLLLCWFGGRALFTARSKKAEASQESSSPGQTVQSSAPARSPVLAILSAEVSSVAGNDLDGLLAGLQQGEIRPALSKHLNTQDGLPVMAALSDALDTESAADFLESWLASAPMEHPARLDPEKARRLLALLEIPWFQTLGLLQNLPPLAATPPSAEPRKRPLFIKLFAAQGWEVMLEAWLHQQLSPLDAFTPGFMRNDAEHPELQHDALRVAGAFNSESGKMPAGSLLILVSCDSHGTEACIAALENDGLLFDGKHQNGSIPGEAAAVVLACPADEMPEGFEALAGLHAAAWGTRQKAVDATGRTDIELLGTLLGGLLDVHAVSADAVAALVSDCDQRSHWTAEAASLISAHLPALDPVADHLALGRALGNTGIASSTLALALAVANVRERKQPGFVASLAHTSHRSLALLRPWPEATT